jgi:SagB-type dehydrogenase family enzyme
MRRRDLLAGLAAVALAGGCARQAPAWVRGSRARYGSPVALPQPAATGTISLEEAIGKRRSERAFGPGTLPVATIGQLLWAGQGITGPGGKRAAPSAGALYPLELYVVTPASVMHYLPQGHQIEARDVPDLRSALEAAAFGQHHVGAAAAIIVVAAVPARTSRKYGPRAAAFAGCEAGHAAQNMLLQATARGLAAVPVGSLDPSRAAAVLSLPPGQTVLYFIPVGPAP